jgi:hypothetical protein
MSEKPPRHTGQAGSKIPDERVNEDSRTDRGVDAERIAAHLRAMLAKLKERKGLT